MLLLTTLGAGVVVVGDKNGPDELELQMSMLRAFEKMVSSAEHGL